MDEDVTEVSKLLARCNWKTSEDTMTLKHVSRRSVSEKNSLPAGYSFFFFFTVVGQSSCYAVSWRERNKESNFEECNTRTAYNNVDTVA